MYDLGMPERTTFTITKDLKKRFKDISQQLGYGPNEQNKFLERMLDCAEDTPSFFKKS